MGRLAGHLRFFLLCAAGPLLGVVDAPTAELVLARVNGERVTLELLEREFESRHQGHIGLLGDEEVVRDFLDAAIRKRLFVQEGRRMELDEDPAFLARIAEERARLAAKWLHETEVERNVVVDEAEIESAVEAQRHVREVIWIQTDTREAAVEARQRILSGEDGESVARDASTHKSSLRGGLKRVTWGTELPRVEQRILSAVDGEVTEPVLAEGGWVVVQLRTTSEMAVEPEKARRTAERVLRQRQMDRRRDAFLDGLRARYRARIRDDMLDPEVLAPLVGQGQSPEDSRSVAEFDGGRITLGEFAAGIRADAFRPLRPFQQQLKASQLLSDRLDTALVRMEGERRWGEAPESLRARLGVFEDDLVFRALVGRVILRGLEATDEEVLEWYEDRRDQYVEPVKVRLAIALLDTEEDARSLLENARSGEPFADLARTRSRDRATATHGGATGWVTRGRAIPALRDVVFDQPVGALGGPVRIEQGWLAYTILERQEARQKPEPQVREQIREELMKRKSGERMDEWERRLREVAEVKVRDSAVRKAGRLLAERRALRFQSNETGQGKGHGGREDAR